MDTVEHVVRETKNDDIIDILRLCTSSDRDEEDFEYTRRRLLSFPVVEIVKSMGEFLVSDDSSVRRETVSLLCWMVGLRADLDFRSTPFILAFFCGRLSDWSSVEFAVHGIRELYSKHISPSVAMEYPAEDESVIQKDRSDLSLLLGYGSVSDLPPSTCTVSERVLTKLLVNVHAPSFGRQVRLEVLQLLKLLIKDFSRDLSPISDLIVKGVAIEGEDERDPNCLCIFFECIELLFESELISSSSSSRSSEELFDTLKSYFPIEAFGDSTDTEVVEKLKMSMNRCLVRFGLTAIEYLVPQLSVASEDAYVALRELGMKRPTDLIPFLIGEWNANSPPLIESLIQSSLEAADDDYITTLINHLYQKGEDDLLVIAANANSRIASTVLQAIPVETSVRLLTRFNFKNEELDLRNPNEFARNLLDFQTSSTMAVISRISGRLTDEDVIRRVVSLLNDTDDVSTDTGRCLSGLFRTPLAEKLHHLGDLKRLVSSLIRLKDTNHVSQSVLAMFRLGQLSVDLVQADWETVVDAFNDVAFSEWVIETCNRDTLPSSVVGRIANCLKKTQILREFIIEKGQIDVLSYISDPEILGNTIQSGQEVQDLLSALITSSSVGDPAAAVRLVVGVGIARGFTEEVIQILKYCENDVLWASGITALTSTDLMKTVVQSQLTEQRAEALLRIALPGTNLEEVVRWLVAQEQLPLGIGIRARLLCSPIVDEIPSDIESCILNSISENDLFGFRLAVKYAIVNPNWSLNFISDLIKTLKKIRDKKVIVRFSAIQILSVLPEMIASGKLIDWKLEVIRDIESLISNEPRFVVRKQAALAITSWYSL